MINPLSALQPNDGASSNFLVEKWEIKWSAIGERGLLFMSDLNQVLDKLRNKVLEVWTYAAYLANV